MTEPEGEPAPELNRGLTIDIVVAAAGTIIIGLIPAPIFALVERSAVALGG
jgi:NADH-quinone oxidoreductase subunit N